MECGRRIELSAGHLDDGDLVSHRYQAGNGVSYATGLDAASMALAAIATRINTTIDAYTAAPAATPARGRAQTPGLLPARRRPASRC
ncbi:hypothetical protein [Dactylosporangium darangshiense]|uniref:2-isopropylmalate synthase LeuA allosteric (dimerisation) domain-containing protein n=1 Tax=Dactylosporangium darangshiense TaxID=579108 RepID=A0ABP8DQ43_9ACTN